MKFYVFPSAKKRTCFTFFDSENFGDLASLKMFVKYNAKFLIIQLWLFIPSLRGKIVTDTVAVCIRYDITLFASTTLL